MARGGMRSIGWRWLAVAAALLAGAHALQFDLPATTINDANARRCVTHYSNKDGLVHGTYKISADTSTVVSLMVVDHNGNRLHSKPTVSGEGTFIFTSPTFSEFDVCFTNTVNPGFAVEPARTRTVTLHIKTGYEAVDYQEVARAEKLKPVELELRKTESMVETVVDELEYMVGRETALRNTNESTYDRLKWFSITSMVLLIALGVYQVLHMRSFLKKKKAI